VCVCVERMAFRGLGFIWITGERDGELGSGDLGFGADGLDGLDLGLGCWGS